MITEITIENFKSFGRPQTIPLKPITLLYGPNSSGKSSIIQFLLMLKQTLENPNNDPLLFKGSLVELGNFKNIIHKHNFHNDLGISFRFNWLGHGEKSFIYKCVFKEYTNQSGIKSLQYLFPSYDSPLINFQMTDEIKSLIVVNRGYRTTAENEVFKKENRFEWEKEAKPSKDVTFNIFDFVVGDHPQIKQIYDFMLSNINVIIIPIKKNLQRILGNKFNFTSLNNLSRKNFVEWVLKKNKNRSSIKENSHFIEELNRFYDAEISILKDKYLQYSNYSNDTFLKEFKTCAGIFGYVNLHNFIFKNKINAKFFNTIGLNALLGHQFIKMPKEWDLASYSSQFNNSNEKIVKAIDPLGFLNTESLGFHFDEDDPYEKYGVPLEEELLKELQKLATNLKKDSQVFSEGLDLSSLTPTKIKVWYKCWGHLGSEKYDELPIINESDLRKYRFSEYYDSVSEYINYVHLRYLKFNLHELVNKVDKEISNFLNKIEYIAPLRLMPERYYLEIQSNKSGVMGRGESVPEILKDSREIEKKLNIILEQLGIEYQVCIKRDVLAENNEGAFSIDLYDKRLKTNVNLKDLGQGISQVMPIIMAGLLKSNSCIIIEQPEIHIHPRLQAELGTFFAECVKNNLLSENPQNNFIVETHSEALILRLQKLIRKKELKPEDVAVIYVEKDGRESVCRELRLDENGEFLDAWPGGFFEESFKELFEE